MHFLLYTILLYYHMHYMHFPFMNKLPPAKAFLNLLISLFTSLPDVKTLTLTLPNDNVLFFRAMV